MEKWINFIEWAIPDKLEREQVRLHVKSAIAGIRSDRILIFFGTGRNGKSVLRRLIEKIPGAPKFLSKSILELNDFAPCSGRYVLINFSNTIDEQHGDPMLLRKLLDNIDEIKDWFME